MPRQIPPLNALKAFEASGRHLNFRRAADELGVTQGAVAQQVRALEATLNVRLFERLVRGVALTDEGRRYLQPVRRAFDLLAEATEHLAPRDAAITISTTPSFATKWLVPRLGQFAEDQPDIRVRLDASDTLVNFQSDGIDIAVRQGASPFGTGLTSTLLFTSDLIVICHPDLVNGANPILGPSDLRHHVLLEDAHGTWPLFLDQALENHDKFDVKTMRFNQTSLAIDAALAGQGVALTPKAFVQDDLQAGRLCQPFNLPMSSEEGFHIVTPRNPRHLTLVDKMRDWLLRQVQPD